MEWIKRNFKWLVLIGLVVGVAVGVTIYFKMFRRDPQWVEQQQKQEKKLDDFDKLLERQGSPKKP